MMLMTGFFNIIDGLVAVFSDDVFLDTSSGVYVFDLTTWGWWMTIWGAILVVTALALYSGLLWARIVAIVIVILNTVSQAAFLPAYPFWSFLIIAVNIFVLWAIIVHGEEQVG